MPRDAAIIAETSEWLTRAAGDLRAADLLLAAEPPMIREALFHLQQSAEKSLKGFLFFHGVTFRRTHSLEEIGQACQEIDQTMVPMIDAGIPLTKFASAGCYPGPLVLPDLPGARAWLEIARTMSR